jgi:hypothetical protein
MAQTTGLRVLKAIGEAVPVRLMKRDLLFVVERLAAVLDERRLAIILRQHGIGKPTSAADTPGPTHINGPVLLYAKRVDSVRRGYGQSPEVFF